MNKRIAVCDLSGGPSFVYLDAIRDAIQNSIRMSFNTPFGMAFKTSFRPKSAPHLEHHSRRHRVSKSGGPNGYQKNSGQYDL